MENRKISLAIATIVILSSTLWCSSSLGLFKQDAPAKFLTISDIHLNSFAQQAPFFGCDTTEPMFEFAMDKFDSLIKAEDPDFILYLGDLPVHQSDSKCWGTLTTIPQDIGVVLGALREKAQQNNVPLLYLPGNNDGIGGDYHSFTDDETGKLITPFTMDGVDSTLWPVINGNNPSNSDIIITQNKELGFYSAYPLGKSKSGKNLRVLMLNTVIFCCQPDPSVWPYYGDDDNNPQPKALNTQMDWILSEMKAARASGDAVIIAMHIPPANNVYGGGPNWTTAPLVYNSQYQKVTVNEVFTSMVNEYSDIITGLLYSHTHMDELKGYFDANNELIELAISTPGVSINHDNNPGMKVFAYNASNYELLDFTTYYAAPTRNAEQKYVWSDWGNAKYTFSGEMGCQPNMTMLDCMNHLQNGKGTLNQQSIVNQLDDFYTVKSPKGGNLKNPEALDIK